MPASCGYQKTGLASREQHGKMTLSGLIDRLQMSLGFVSVTFSLSACLRCFVIQIAGEAPTSTLE